MPQKIQLEQISLAADRPLVSDVSFTLRRGQVLALLGSSGCGKSLTCAAALGLLPPGVRQTAGRVLLDGIPVHGEQLRGATIATRIPSSAPPADSTLPRPGMVTPSFPAWPHPAVSSKSPPSGLTFLPSVRVNTATDFYTIKRTRPRGPVPRGYSTIRSRRNVTKNETAMRSAPST